MVVSAVTAVQEVFSPLLQYIVPPHSLFSQENPTYPLKSYEAEAEGQVLKTFQSDRGM